MRTIRNYSFINLLEDINLSSDGRIDLREPIEAEENFAKYIKLIGYNAHEFIKTSNGEVCLFDDLNTYGAGRRSEGFINGYIMTLKILKGELLWCFVYKLLKSLVTNVFEWFILYLWD